MKDGSAFHFETSGLNRSVRFSPKASKRLFTTLDYIHSKSLETNYQTLWTQIDAQQRRRLPVAAMFRELEPRLSSSSGTLIASPANSRPSSASITSPSSSRRRPRSAVSSATSPIGVSTQPSLLSSASTQTPVQLPTISRPQRPWSAPAKPSAFLLRDSSRPSSASTIPGFSRISTEMSQQEQRLLEQTRSFLGRLRSMSVMIFFLIINSSSLSSHSSASPSMSRLSPRSVRYRSASQLPSLPGYARISTSSPPSRPGSSSLRPRSGRSSSLHRRSSMDELDALVPNDEGDESDDGFSTIQNVRLQSRRPKSASHRGYSASSPSAAATMDQVSQPSEPVQQVHRLSHAPTQLRAELEQSRYGSTTTVRALRQRQISPQSIPTSRHTSSTRRLVRPASARRPQVAYDVSNEPDDFRVPSAKPFTHHPQAPTLYSKMFRPGTVLTTATTSRPSSAFY